MRSAAGLYLAARGCLTVMSSRRSGSVQHSFAGAAQFLHEDFSARDAACFLQDICIDFRKLVVPLVAQGPAWAMCGMVAFPIQWLLAA